MKTNYKPTSVLLSSFIETGNYLPQQYHQTVEMARFYCYIVIFLIGAMFYSGKKAKTPDFLNNIFILIVATVGLNLFSTWIQYSVLLDTYSISNVTIFLAITVIALSIAAILQPQFYRSFRQSMNNRRRASAKSMTPILLKQEEKRRHQHTQRCFIIHNTVRLDKYKAHFILWGKKIAVELLGNTTFQFIISISLNLTLGIIMIWLAVRRTYKSPLAYETIAQVSVSPDDEKVKSIIANFDFSQWGSVILTLLLHS